MTSAHPIRGLSVLVLGASGGLGTALCRELHNRGAVLTLVGRDQKRLDDVPVPGARHVSDLRMPGAAERCIDLSVIHGGKLDVIVNAIGVVAFAATTDLSIDAMEELFLTNTFVPIMVAKAGLNRLEPGGAFLNISGVIAEQNLPGMAAYGASKAAVRSFDEALAREARRLKIRVIDARPPHTETGLATRAIEGEAPNMPTGLSPESVATTICDALEAGTTDLPSSAFSG